MSTATPEVADRPPRTERLAIYLFPDAEELDFAGPWEVLSYWAREVAAGNGIAAEVVTVADVQDLRAAKGLQVVPDTTWDELDHRPSGARQDRHRRMLARAIRGTTDCARSQTPASW
jgi:transcriptional regulator GlxA family with amidase domain